MANLKDYDRGRSDGLSLALRIVREDGLEGLERECRFRNISGVHTSLALKELDIGAFEIRMEATKSVMVWSLAALHDAFGFGQKRLQMYMEQMDKIASYIKSGWLDFHDIVTSIENELELKLVDKWISKQDLDAHPRAEDIYPDAELVRKDAWRQILTELGFREARNENYPVSAEAWDILDQNGVPQWCYFGEFERIGMYDVLKGIKWGRDHDWTKSAGEAKVPTANVRKKKKRRR